MLRFRLRTFLIAITLFCLLLGWRIAAVERVERPIRELEKLGWHLSYYKAELFPAVPLAAYDERSSYWQKLLLGYQDYDLPVTAWIGEHSGFRTPNEALQQSCMWFNRLPTIASVDLAALRVTNDCLVRLAGCEHLRSLNLSFTNLDDTEVNNLAQLTQLDSLMLWNTNLTAEGAAELERRLPDCIIDHDYNDD